MKLSTVLTNRMKYLHLRQNSKPYNISVSDSQLLDSHSGIYRSSPIFPLIQPSTSINLTGNNFIVFLYYEHAFAVLGKILSELPEAIHKKIWFSHGLASILIFTENLDDIEIITSNSPEIRAEEIWRVSDSNLHDYNFELYAQASINPADYKLRDYSGLNSDLKFVLNEFSHCLTAATTRAAQYMPNQLAAFSKLASAVDKIVEELLYLEGLDYKEPSFVSSITLKDIISNDVKKKKHFHFLSSQLVQINSAISYLISQGLSGICPILENECHVRTYSLLGIGTAYSALACFTRHVESVFEGFPIAESLSLPVYKDHPAPTPFTSIREYDISSRTEWDSRHYGIDKFLPKEPAISDNPKLVYYSGRQGFRETKFSVSAPINILNAAASARWSLMTLSHELMHAHVTSVLAAIFEDTSQTTDALFSQIAKDFFLFRRGRLERTLCMTDFLRFALLNYCCFSELNNGILKNVSKDKEPEADDIDITPYNIKSIIDKHFNDINELIVHVLDFTYFYDCDESLYIGLLWESWTPVPVVLDKIEKYLLRSLVAVGVKESGNCYNRFFAAAKTVNFILNELLKTDPSNVVVAQAAASLEEASKVGSSIFFRFNSAIYIAEIASKFLTSTNIHGSILYDELRIVEDNTPFYSLELGSFAEKFVQSPVALCDNLLRIALAGNNDLIESEIASAWTFLACASFNR